MQTQVPVGLLLGRGHVVAPLPLTPAACPSMCAHCFSLYSCPCGVPACMPCLVRGGGGGHRAPGVLRAPSAPQVPLRVHDVAKDPSAVPPVLRGILLHCSEARYSGASPCDGAGDRLVKLTVESWHAATTVLLSVTVSCKRRCPVMQRWSGAVRQNRQRKHDVVSAINSLSAQLLAGEPSCGPDPEVVEVEGSEA